MHDIPSLGNHRRFTLFKDGKYYGSNSLSYNVKYDFRMDIDWSYVNPETNKHGRACLYYKTQTENSWNISSGGCDFPLNIDRPDLANEIVVRMDSTSGKQGWMDNIKYIKNYNQSPLAYAGIDRYAPVGSRVTLDASLSSDREGDFPLQYLWTLESKPEYSNASLDNEANLNPVFTADKTGEYRLSLQVTDARGAVSELVSMSVFALEDMSGQTFMIDDFEKYSIGSLDGQGDWHTSFGCNGGPEIVQDESGNQYLRGRPECRSMAQGLYHNHPWLFGTQFYSKASIRFKGAFRNGGLDGNISATMQFVFPHTADSEGPSDSLWFGLHHLRWHSEGLQHTRRVMLYSNGVYYGTASVPLGVWYDLRLDIDWNHQSPTTGKYGLGCLYYKDVSSSDWLEAPAACNIELNITDPQFSRGFSVRLDAEEKVGQIDDIRVIYDNISFTNIPPISIPESISQPPFSVGTPVLVSGSQSYDPDNHEPLSFEWTIKNKPDNSIATFTDTKVRESSFTPDVPGIYTISLIVTDSLGLVSEQASITIDTKNSDPVAVIDGEDNPQTRTLLQLGQIMFNGSDSYDDNGDVLVPEWSLGSSAGTIQTDALDPWLAILNADTYDDYQVILKVTDSYGATDTVTVNLNISNIAPTVNVIPVGTKVVGNTVTFTGEIFDANNDPLSFLWTLTKSDGTQVSLTNDSSLTPFLTLMNPGDYRITLFASDGELETTAVQSFFVLSVVDISIQNILNLQANISLINDQYFKNKNSLDKIMKLIERVLRALDQGDINSAVRVLEMNLLTILDGCANGGLVDSADLIQNCEEQIPIYNQVMSIMDSLNNI